LRRLGKRKREREREKEREREREREMLLMDSFINTCPFVVCSSIFLLLLHCVLFARK
jgi:hypothetical protein